MYTVYYLHTQVTYHLKYTLKCRKITYYKPVLNKRNIKCVAICWLIAKRLIAALCNPTILRKY